MTHNDFQLYLGRYEGISAFTASNSNPHTNIVGGSGGGKTTQMVMMAESFHAQGGTVIIFGYSGIFDQNQIYKPLLPYYLEYCRQYEVHQEGIHVDLFKIREMNDGTLQNKIDVIGGITDAFANATGIKGKQKSTLRTAIGKLYENGKYYTKGIKGLDEMLSNAAEKEASEVKESIYYILAHNVFRPSEKDMFFEFNTINMINLSGFNWDAQRVITEVLLNEVFSLAQTGAFLEQPLMLVIDEVQNFDNQSIIPRLLNEGRKYGIGLVTSTQLILKGSTNKIIQRLPGAAVNLFFKPQYNRIHEVARNINPAEASKYSVELGNLKTGEFIAVGNFRVGREVFNNTPLILSAYMEEDEIFLENAIKHNVTDIGGIL